MQSFWQLSWWVLVSGLGVRLGRVSGEFEPLLREVGFSVLRVLRALVTPGDPRDSWDEPILWLDAVVWVGRLWVILILACVGHLMVCRTMWFLYRVVAYWTMGLLRFGRVAQVIAEGPLGLTGVVVSVALGWCGAMYFESGLLFIASLFEL